VHELEYAYACEQRHGKITVLTGLEIYTGFNSSGKFVFISKIMLKTMRHLQNAYWSNGVFFIALTSFVKK
jgi:hypothetical protein